MGEVRSLHKVIRAFALNLSSCPAEGCGFRLIEASRLHWNPLFQTKCPQVARQFIDREECGHPLKTRPMGAPVVRRTHFQTVC